MARFRLARTHVICASDLPPTQTDIADATGLTPVHVRRRIQVPRGMALIILEGRKLVVPDMLALQQAGRFNCACLHHHRLNRHNDEARGLAAASPETA